jgi:hypothetical protein
MPFLARNGAKSKPKMTLPFRTGAAANFHPKYGRTVNRSLSDSQAQTNLHGGNPC